MSIIVFGIGANLGDKTKNINSAIAELNFLYGCALAVASFYLSSPLPSNDVSSPDYTNTAIAFDINLQPEEILLQIKQVEKKIGRTSNKKWHSREIDIDILIYENHTSSNPILNIPHKELLNRDFALLPLIEVLNKLKKDASIYENATLNLKQNFVKQILDNH